MLVVVVPEHNVVFVRPAIEVNSVVELQIFNIRNCYVFSSIIKLLIIKFEKKKLLLF